MTASGLSACHPQRAILFLYFSVGAQQSHCVAESNIPTVPLIQGAPKVEQHTWEICIPTE